MFLSPVCSEFVLPFLIKEYSGKKKPKYSEEYYMTDNWVIFIISSYSFDIPLLILLREKKIYSTDSSVNNLQVSSPVFLNNLSFPSSVNSFSFYWEIIDI